MLYGIKANVVHALGDIRAEVTMCDRAIEIHERLVNVEGRHELAGNLVNCYKRKAVAVRALGDIQAAVALYDRAIEINERLVNVEGRPELANDLAKLYMNKANAVRDLGDNRAAVALYDRAIEIYERLVNVKGRREFGQRTWQRSIRKRPLQFDTLGDNQAAVALYDRAIEFYERLVNVEGRRELANDLATSTGTRPGAVRDLGDNQSAWLCMIGPSRFSNGWSMSRDDAKWPMTWQCSIEQGQ